MARDLDSDPMTDPDTAAAEKGFLSAGPARREPESIFVRIIATAGVVGIGTLLGAVLTANGVAGWIVGLVVSLTAVALAGVLWRSRTL